VRIGAARQRPRPSAPMFVDNALFGRDGCFENASRRLDGVSSILKVSHGGQYCLRCVNTYPAILAPQRKPRENLAVTSAWSSTPFSASACPILRITPRPDLAFVVEKILCPSVSWRAHMNYSQTIPCAQRLTSGCINFLSGDRLTSLTQSQLP
jgi:hypothetical protein